MKCNFCENEKQPEDFYINKSRCKSCMAHLKNMRDLDRRLKLIEYKGGKCIDCKGTFMYYSYDLHHLIPSQKDFDFRDLQENSWENILLEADKCVLLCRNCHADRHYKEKAIEKLSIHEMYKEKIKQKQTGKKAGASEERKEKMRAAAIRRKDRIYPNKKELKDLIWQKSTVQIAADYGVSDVAVSKWCKSMGIIKPPRGYWAKKAAGKI